MNSTIFAQIYSDALTANAVTRDAFISDWALSSIWGDDLDSAEIPHDRIDEISRIYDVANMSMRDLIDASGMSQHVFAETFMIPKRSVENWSTGVRSAPEYVKLMIARSLGMCWSPNLEVEP